MKVALSIRTTIVLLAGVCGCLAAAADETHAAPSWQIMQRAVLRDRDLGEVEGLLKAGFDPAHPIGCGTSDSLDGALSVDSPDMVSLLLRYGARPKQSTFVRAAFLASSDHALQIVTAFLRAGSDVNSKEYYPSHRAASYRTALQAAVWRQNVELVRLLLAQKGISLNDASDDGKTAFDVAKDKGNPEIIALLARAGAASAR
jgi:ankyrin repeat protein